MPDVVFDSGYIGQMAEQVKDIQQQGIHTLKFKVEDSEDKSTDGMIKYLVGQNVEQRKVEAMDMLNKLYKDLKAKVSGV